MATVLDDLARLIAFPTVSNRPVTELAAFVAGRLEDLGFAVDLYASDDMPGGGIPGKVNLVASIGPEGTEGLTLSGHMDVVPTENQPWSTDPFVLTRRGDRVLGRGTADMKGFLAAVLQALDARRGATFHRQLALVWTHDEEVGCLGSARLVQQLAKEERRFPSACLIGEPTDFQILRMHPGHVAFDVHFTGAAAHSSRPDLGTNAIEAAADAIIAVRQLARELESETAHEGHFARPWVAMNTGCIHGGSAVNIVPDRCSVQIGYRPMPGMSSDDVFERVRQRINGLELEAEIEYRLIRTTPSMLTPANTPLATLLADHANKGMESATFATDGGNLRKLGMLPLVFGPGSIEVAHKADEFVEIEALHKAVDVVGAVIDARCL